MTFQRPHVIIVECGYIKLIDTKYSTEIDVFVNDKNVNNEIISREASVHTKTFARIESLWVFSFGLFFLITSIS